jgi:L-ribulokinase
MGEAGQSKYVIGVDYGTNSVRAVVVRVGDGEELANAVFDYPSGEAGILLDPSDPHLARQNPSDYLEGFCGCVSEGLKQAQQADTGFSADHVIGIGVDTTGSTPLPVDRTGRPVAMNPKFKDNLAAHAWLWKDHTAHAEAAEITETAKKLRPQYLGKCGGVYSSEWFWSKILHCRRSTPAVFDAAYSWVELADFVPAWLTGCTDPTKMVRGVCPAGHKAMYNTQWGGLPDKEFLAELDPALADLRDRLYDKAITADKSAGPLTGKIAGKVGLRPGIPVAAGTFDAHAGGVGAGIQPGILVKIIGTSTCDMMVASMDGNLPDVPGLCGIVPGSILPSYLGLEAGQSAVGDIFNWFVKQLFAGRYTNEAEAHAALSDQAAKLKAGESGLVALDWNNGNRTILVDPRLTGMLIGQTLHTTGAEIYRALIEATAYGALTIINRFEEYGVKVEEVINCGGIAEKNPLAMQIYADVICRPMKISRSGQTCAIGAAIYAAVAAGSEAGGYPDVLSAQKKMTGTKEHVYRPDPKQHKIYRRLYSIYKGLHDSFGIRQQQDGLFNVMKELIAIREQTRQGQGTSI